MKIIIATLCFVTLICNNAMHAQAWQTQDPNFPYKTTPFDVICPNTTDAWTFGFEYDSSFTSFSQVNYTLSRTTDSGQTWESISFPHTEPGYFSSLSALNGDVAWIAYVDYAEGNKVLKTTDGGLNWTQLPIYVGGWINLAHFFDENTGVVMGDPDSLGFEIYTTIDGGESWTRVDNNTIPPSLPDEYAYAGFYEVVGSEIWFESTVGRVFHSPDYGNTWNVINGPLPMPFFLMAVDYAKTVYMGYSMSDNPDGSDPLTSLYRSSDNGISWEDITPLDNGWWIFDIEPVPGTNTIVASVNAGYSTGLFETWISYNRGDSWTSIDNSAHTLVIDFADAETGFAGKWQMPEDLSPTLIYNYIGSPLTSLLDPKPLAIDLLVSPNPASDFIKISVTAEALDRYLILLNDINGKLVYRTEKMLDGAWTKEINIASLPAGTYTLSIATTTGVRTLSVVKL
ncbi:MAG: T9SS type A sorting domain-containing protein [Chitinophagales bacterium]|nr:T9SS type A sorting domain-containing protein [Chitinophagales bacterium]